MQLRENRGDGSSTSRPALTRRGRGQMWLLQTTKHNTRRQRKDFCVIYLLYVM